MVLQACNQAWVGWKALVGDENLLLHSSTLLLCGDRSFFCDLVMAGEIQLIARPRAWNLAWSAVQGKYERRGRYLVCISSRKLRVSSTGGKRHFLVAPFSRPLLET